MWLDEIVLGMILVLTSCLFAGSYGNPTGPSTAATPGRLPQQAPTSQPPQMQTLVQPSMQQGMQPTGLVQPAMQLQAPSQAYQQQSQTRTQFAPAPQQAAQQTRQQSISAAVQTLNSAPPQAAPGMQQMSYTAQQAPTAGSSQQSVAPANVQYIQLADGTIRAMVPVQGDVPRGSQLDVVSQEPQKVQTLQAPPLQTSAPVYPSTLNSAPTEYPSQYSNAPSREQPSDFQQLVAPPDLRTSTLPDPNPALDPVVGVVESVSAPDPGTGALPSDATATLYVEDVPTDMSKRELSHIFRPFGGFKVSSCHVPLFRGK